MDENFQQITDRKEAGVRFSTETIPYARGATEAVKQIFFEKNSQRQKKRRSLCPSGGRAPEVNNHGRFHYAIKRCFVIACGLNATILVCDRWLIACIVSERHTIISTIRC